MYKSVQCIREYSVSECTVYQCVQCIRVYSVSDNTVYQSVQCRVSAHFTITTVQRVQCINCVKLLISAQCTL